MKTPYILIPNKSITAVVNGRSQTVLNDNPKWADVLKALKSNNETKFLATLRAATDKKSAVERVDKRIRVVGSKVLYGEEELHGSIVDRILSFASDNFSTKPLEKFLENLMINTEKDVRNQLYNFLEHNDLPITEDGAFYAFKLVKLNGRPYYNDNGQYVYEVGKTYEMPREEVVKSSYECAGPGLYAGNKNYWGSGFDSSGNFVGNSDGKMLVVKIFPQWVISVPTSESAKLRAYKFIVVEEYKNTKNLQKKLVVNSKRTFSKLPKRDKSGRFIPKNTPKRSKNGRFC